MKRIIIMLFVCILLTGCGTKDKNISEKELKNNKTKKIVNSIKNESKTTTETKTTTVKKESTTIKSKTYNTTTSKSTTKATVTTTKACTPKKFSQKYSYVYNTFEQCKKEGNNAFFYILDNVDNRVFSYNCSAIKDECGSTWYGVYFYIWENDKEKVLYY